MLELRDVDTHYDGVPMLRGVSLRVEAGEVVCLLGPNGAGKTTTFRAITGLVPAARGDVSIMGQRVERIRTERIAALGVGLVPEGRRLFPDLTVRENLWLGYQAAGGGNAFEARLEEMGTMFPRVRERLRQTAGTLSGGEQAMVALARALIGQPKLVIMDEPSLGLSPRLIEEYFAIVARMREAGTTVLLIEQNAEKALQVADRGYVLVKGRIVTEGPTRALIEAEAVRQLYF
jgi:branched-chain amino acid transport system ATP-binding protein